MVHGIRLVAVYAVLGLALTGAWARPARSDWIRISTPEFTLLTTLNAREAAARTSDFVQYLSALRAYLKPSSSPLPALTVVVFAKDVDFQKYWPLKKDGEPERAGGFFGREESWAVIGLPASISDDVRHAIFHEGVHWYLSRSSVPLPLWLEEGMAEVFSTFRVADGKGIWGEPREDHVEQLRNASRLSVARLLCTSRSDLFADRQRTTLFYAQAWLFVHFLTFGKHGLPPDSAMSYASLLAGGMDPDVAFQRAFGRSYEAMDGLLETYLRDGGYRVSRRSISVASSLHAEPAASIDVEEALGRLALVGGRPQDAVIHAGRMIASNSEDWRGHALLGLADKDIGNRQATIAELRYAVTLGATDFQPYVVLASMLHHDAVADGPGLSDEDARRLADWYERAIQLNPNYDLSYHNLAGLTGILSPVKPLDRADLEAGAKLFPHDLSIQLGIAQLTRRGGDLTGARAIVARVQARNAGVNLEVSKGARDILTAWNNEDLFNEVNRLMDAQQFTEALHLVDTKAPTIADPIIRHQLETLRPELTAAVATQSMNDALDEERFAEARRIIAGILASDAPPETKAQVRQVLADLDARNLTSDPKPN